MTDADLLICLQIMVIVSQWTMMSIIDHFIHMYTMHMCTMKPVKILGMMKPKVLKVILN